MIYKSMSIAKRWAKRNGKRFLPAVLTVATLVWSLGVPLGILLPTRASAAVTVSADVWADMNEMMGSYMMRPLIGLKITGSAGESLDSITVTATDVASSGFAAATDIAPFNDPGLTPPNDSQGLCIYEDTNANGWFDPGTDTVLDWESKPSWSGPVSGVYTAVLDVVDDVLPTSYSGEYNYFIHMQAGQNPSAGHSFKISVPTDGIATSGTSPTLGSALTTGTITITGGGTGDYVEAPYITDVKYIDYKMLDVTFNVNMNSTTTNCSDASSCTNIYELSTVANDSQQIVFAALQGDNKTVRLTAHADARIAASYSDTIRVSTDFEHAPKDATNGMPQSDGTPRNTFIEYSSVKISEVQIAGTNTTDEFIELYNSGTSAASITGWKLGLLDISADSYVALATIGSVSLDPGEYYLLANDANSYNASISADATFTGADIANNDTVILYDSSVTPRARDILGIGSTASVYEGAPYSDGPGAGASLERKATPSATAATMATGGADATAGNSYDSDNNLYDFITAATSGPQNSSATAESMANAGGGSGYTNQAPQVEHMPLVNAVAANELKVPARVSDPDDSFSQLAERKLCYKAGNVSTWPGIPTCVNGQLASGSDVSFTIPSTAVTTEGIDYYIHIEDSSGNKAFACASPAANTQALAQASPYRINVSSTSGSRSISGYVCQASNCGTASACEASAEISGATVYVEGAGMNATTGSDGAFTINNVPDGVYNLRATAGGYMDGDIWGVSVNLNNPNSSGWKFCLQSGTSGVGGDIDKPHVMYTAPFEGMMGAPTDISQNTTPIIVGLDKGLDSTTVTASNVLLKKMAGSTASTVSGYSVAYNSSNREISIYSDTALEVGYTYVVEITNAVTDESGNSIQGPRVGGGHEFMFTTSATAMADFGSGSGFEFTEGDNMDYHLMMMDSGYADMMTKYDTTTGKWEGGAYNPPYIFGSFPAPGAWNVPANTKAVFNFSEAIDSNSVNKSNFRLFQKGSTSETDLTDSMVSSVDLDTKTKTIVTMAMSNLGEGEWIVKVRGAVRSTSGITLGDPANPTAYVYVSEFNVGTSSDSTAPQVLGTYPSDGATGVPMDFGFVDIGFDEPIDPSGVNTSNISLKTGTSEVPGTVDYDPMNQSAKFFPTVGLMPGATYTLTINTNIQDLAGNALASDVTKSFTMSTTVDTEKPRIEFANADDYSLAISYSKPMNAAKITDTTRWGSSVLNPGNYAVKKNSTGPGTGDDYTIPDTASFVYDSEFNTVKIKGLALGTQGFEVTVTGVKDLMGNPINVGAGENQTGGPVMSSADTMGFIGPGGGGMMGPPPGSMGGTASTGMMGKPTGFGGHMASDMAMMPVGVHPMNMMAGATTTFFVDFPISATKNIPDGGSVKLTFPKGFDVSNVIPDPYNPDRNDLNMMGPGTVTLKTSGVTADGSSASTKGGAAADGMTVSGQTVTLHMAVSGNSSQTGAPDFLHFEVKGVVNSSIPKDFDTSGYTVDMKSYDENGTMLESKTSMPFFISAGGERTLTVNVYLDNASTPDDKTCTGINLFMGSPMTGPQDTTIDFTSGSATHDFTSLPNGDYHVFMEPTFSCDGTKYSVNTSPEPIWISGSNVIKNIVAQKLDASSSAQLTVSISGTFDSNGESVDIFAGGPSGFAVETTTLTGTVSGQDVTLYLPSNGDYMVGMGPAIPKGPMMGPPPMPDWMPPQPINVNVSGIGGTVAINDEYGNDVTSSGISFTIGTADKQIIGIVTDGVAADGYPNGTPISNAEVFGHQPMGFGGRGSHTQTAADGTFTLKVAEYGMYNVGAFSPGMPESPEKSVDVKSGTGSSTQVYISGQLSTGSTGANPFVIKLKQPDYTVSGKISDYNGNALQYAPVMARETTTGRITHTGTDQNGNYILFVDAGTWVIKAEMPYGTDACGAITKTVTVSSSTGNLSNENIQPTSGTCYTVSGTVSVGGSAVSNIPVFLEEWDTANDRPAGGYHRDAMTDADGAYRFKVGPGVYRVGSWTPDYGELTVSGGTVTVTDADVTANITAADLYTLSVPITGGTTDMTGFLEMKATNGFQRKGIAIRAGDLTGTPPTLSASLPAGTYDVRLHLDGVGDYSEDDIDLTSGNATATVANFNVTTTVTAAPIRTISGTVKDADGNAVKDALVWIQNPATNLRKDTTTDSSGDYTLKIKQGDDYKMGVDKPGFTSPAPAEIDISANIDYDFDTDTSGDDATDLGGVNNMLANTRNISGTIYKSDGTTPADSGFVWAEKDGGGWSGAEVNQDGTYELSVSDGDWTVKAIGPQHTTTKLTAAHTVSSSSTNTGQDVTLVEKTTNEIKSKIASITPSVGGIIDDTNNSGIKLVIPPNALGRESNPATITIEETYSVPQSSSSKPIGESTIKITAKDYDGNSITSFNSDVEMVVQYDEDEITALGMDETDLSLNYWDTTTSQYVILPATQDTGTNTIAGFVDHFTSFAPTVASDASSPTAPSSVTATGSESSVAISWTGSTDDVSVAGYEVYRSASESGTYENISGDSTSGGAFDSAVLVSGTSYTDTAADVGVTYYYKVSAYDTSGNVSASSAASAGAGRTDTGMIGTPGGSTGSADTSAEEAIDEAEVEAQETAVEAEPVAVPVAVVAPIAVSARNIPKRAAKVNMEAERGALRKMVRITRAVPATSAQWKVVHFMAYGAGERSAKATAEERQKVMEDYKAVYGELPQKDAQWEDVEKIMGSHRPGRRNLERERKALGQFTEIYRRLPDFENVHDKWAMDYMAYRIRIKARSLDTERAALASFRDVFGRLPSDMEDWAMFRAIAYSGAKR